MSSANKGRKELCYKATWKALSGAKSHRRARAKLQPSKYMNIPNPVPSYDQDVK
jgi:hypothetical protein